MRLETLLTMLPVFVIVTGFVWLVHSQLRPRKHKTSGHKYEYIYGFSPFSPVGHGQTQVSLPYKCQVYGVGVNNGLLGVFYAYTPEKQGKEGYCDYVAHVAELGGRYIMDNSLYSNKCHIVVYNGTTLCITLDYNLYGLL